MAKKNNEPVKPVEPESESTDEETDGSSDSEEEKPETTFKKPTNTVTNKPDSSDEEESESDSEPETTINNTKPVKAPQPDSEESESGSDSGPKPSVTPSKRLAAEPTKSVAKKPKIVKPETESVSNSSKKVLFQRLWSDEDEIVILNGMIEFEAKNNVSPTSDLANFLDFIKKDLHVEFSKKQLQSKIRNLRKRYENNKGKDKSSMKPHEKAALEFSEKIWGRDKGKTVVAASSGIANGSVVRKNVKKEKTVVEVSNGALKKKAFVRKMSSSFGLSNEERLLKIGAELFGGEDEIAGSEEWKKLEREEMELSLKQLDVKRAKMKLVLDTME